MKATHGKVVSLYYRLTDEDGEQLDSSRDGEPLAYLHGYGNIIPGLESALEGQKAGFSGTVTVPPANGYGEHQPEAVLQVPRSQFPPNEDIQVGMQVHGESERGVQRFTVAAVNEQYIVLDGNHPLAGKTLHFAVEVMAVRDATAQELAHGHVHAHGHDH